MKIRTLGLVLLLCILGLCSVQAQTDSSVSNTWPREFKSSLGVFTVYTPQVESWKDQRELQAWMAVMLEPKDTPKNVLPGAVLLSGQTAASSDNSQVLLSDIKVNEVKFPDADDAMTTKIKTVLSEELSTRTMLVSSQRIMAQLDKNDVTAKDADVSTSAPKIFTSNEPAILVQFDGAPILSPLGDTGLLYAVNTNWDVIVDSTSTKVFLLNKDQWLYSTEIEKPNWQFVRDPLPETFNKIPENDDSWSDVRKQIPAKPIPSNAKLPKVFISYAPAELILFDGAPQMRTISGTKLMCVKNTESDVFYYMPDQVYYYLVSGRWFSSKSMDGPWEYATDKLPEDFSKIPETDEMARVLASVPGTDHAKNAVIMANMPKVAAVSRDEKPTIEVTYANDKPQFTKVEKLDVSYATNTPNIVFNVGPNYYCCFSGVWYVSSSATGPWAFCDSVPTVIYQIPATVPVYPATYVRVYDSRPNVIVYGYSDGYNCSYVYGGTVVYGTGYYYRPWVEDVVTFGLGVLTGWAIDSWWRDHDWYCHDWNWFHRPPPPFWRGPRPHHPWYYPPFGHAYGGGACFNPRNGGWLRHGHCYGPYGGINAVSRFDPHTGRFMRGFEANGPDRSGFGGTLHNPRTNTFGGVRGGEGPYRAWNNNLRGGNGGREGFISDRNGDRYVQGRDGWSKFDGNRWTRTDEPKDLLNRRDKTRSDLGITGREGNRLRNSKGDNLFVGRNGQIYRKEGNNNWQEYGRDGKWNRVDTDRIVNRRTGNESPTGDRTATGRRNGTQVNNRGERGQTAQPGRDTNGTRGDLNHNSKKPGDNNGDLNRRGTERPTNGRETPRTGTRTGNGKDPSASRDTNRGTARPGTDRQPTDRNGGLNHNAKKPGDNSGDLNRSRTDQPSGNRNTERREDIQANNRGTQQRGQTAQPGTDRSQKQPSAQRSSQGTLTRERQNTNTSSRTRANEDVMKNLQRDSSARNSALQATRSTRNFERSATTPRTSTVRQSQSSSSRSNSSSRSSYSAPSRSSSSSRSSFSAPSRSSGSSRSSFSAPSRGSAPRAGGGGGRGRR